MWYSPKSERFYGGIHLLKKRAPVLGGIYLFLFYFILLLMYLIYFYNLFKNK